MMRTTDGTIGLMIANAANHEIISRADAECVLDVLDLIGSDAQMEIEEGEPNPDREKLLQHRADLCAGVRDAIEGRLRSAASGNGSAAR
ncbi:MAG: hypothetical protein HYR85_09925 [Planctomycetes bacterium]|nr:hypothetical protein [Planctomycetota bacterium]